MVNEDLFQSKKCKVTRYYDRLPSDRPFEYRDKLAKDGYKDWYYNADYHWGMINPDERKIFTNTEGDITIVECGSNWDFNNELERQYKGWKDLDNDIAEELKKKFME